MALDKNSEMFIVNIFILIGFCLNSKVSFSYREIMGG